MSPSIWQLLIVAAIVFLLFGSKRLPTMMEDVAKAMKSFKKGMADEQDSPPRPKTISARDASEDEKKV